MTRRVELTIVGGGPNQGEFEQIVQQLKLEGAVTFRGYVAVREELWRVYRGHDMFVLPSLTEGAPKVVIEAFANGLPVVATNIGGIPGMVSPESGILVPPNDVAALGDAIRRILTDDRMSPQQLSEALIAAAGHAGAPDNVTVVVVRIEPGESADDETGDI